MVTTPAPILRCLSSGLLLSAPSLAVLVALVVTKQLPWWQAAASWFAITAGLALLIRRHIGGLSHLRAFADRLAGDPTLDAPDNLRRSTPMVRDAVSAVLRLARAGREQAEELRRLADMRGNVLDSVPDPLLTLDDQMRVVLANQSARHLLGQGVAGREVATVLRDPSVLAAIRAALYPSADPAADSARTVEVTLSDPIERDFVLGVQRLAVRAPDGTSAVLILHDVTALRRAERMRADFIANASHELRTPLAALIGFVETLRGPARDDAGARDQFLEIMQEQAQRMGRLVEDLLSLSRIEQREYETPTDRVDLAHLVERVVAGLQLHAARRDMTLKLSVTAPRTRMLGAADDLTQLAQNLIDNALKYGRPGTAVEIDVKLVDKLPPAMPRSAHGVIVLAVRDYGEGIAREHLPRLTERFYRIDKARSRAVGGTGLGLAICKHIISRHRGVLTIDSEPGRGSLFAAHFPLLP